VVARRWEPPESHHRPPPLTEGFHRSFRSSLEDDGQTLHFSFTGGEPKYVEYPNSEVMESNQAVAVIPIAHDTGPPGPRRAKGYGREVVVRFRGTLGARVLINLNASPVVVVTPQGL